ncbi:MAG: DUF6677 family protein [Phycisphaerae bacterium]
MSNQSYSAYSSRPAPPAADGPSATGYLAIILAWAVPGLGHFLVGEKARGTLFAVIIHALFAFGMLIGGIRAINPPDQPIWTYTQYLAGWPMLIAGRVEKSWMPQPDHHGSRFNQLMQEYDSQRPNPADDSQIPQRKAYARKMFEKYPILTYHPKIQDVGSVYCGIAGMLNLLVMFDVLLRVTGTERENAPDKNRPLAEAAK